jgi:hypothetical protein
VLFRPAYQLVQELLAAKRDLTLPRLLRRLDATELLILDDIGYVKQSAKEAEVLFTLIAQRYERRSVMITSNLVFSEWERISRSRWPRPPPSTAWCTIPPSLSLTPPAIGLPPAGVAAWVSRAGDEGYARQIGSLERPELGRVVESWLVEKGAGMIHCGVSGEK